MEGVPKMARQSGSDEDNRQERSCRECPQALLVFSFCLILHRCKYKRQLCSWLRSREISQQA